MRLPCSEIVGQSFDGCEASDTVVGRERHMLNAGSFRLNFLFLLSCQTLIRYIVIEGVETALE